MSRRGNGGKVLSAVLLAAATVSAAPKEELAFFELKIRPVLAEHCYSCHSAEAKKLKGNLYLDSKAGWQKGGDSGEPAIVPGDPEASLLLRTVKHLEEDLQMPPKKPKLPDQVIADLTAWVQMGAPDPREGAIAEAKRADKSWWSLQPLATDFQHDSVDGFVRAQLAEKGLTLSPRADAHTLIRRVTYDLHGLPPQPDEVEAFTAASARDADTAYKALVDRLLASPRYGERWGRHWLDVIRFGESNGFERNFVIDDLWPFRDYVIKSINDDKPFDRLIIEHLAGDVIGKDDPAVEVGSAFLVAGPYDDVGNQDPVAKANIRAATLDDMITATSGAFLGLTVNCARCHNHKFDPIPAEDYYRLRAAFEGVTHGRRTIASREEREAHAHAAKPLQQERDELTASIATLEKTIEGRAKIELAKRRWARPKIDSLRTEEWFPPAEARHVRLVMRANTANPHSASGAGRLTEFEVWTAGEPGRNAALAGNGGKAEGARSAVAEDFPEAYGPQMCIDGRFGEQWFIGTPATLTITLAKPELIRGIAFSNAKGSGLMDKAQGATPCEYEVLISGDGENWRSVANGDDREPWSEAHGVARVRSAVTSKEEGAELARLKRRLAEVEAALAKAPKLRVVWAGQYAQPKEPTFLHKGGDPMKPGAAVAPASLHVLDHVTPSFELPLDAPEGERRLALARWIVDGNPLTARVLANRVWHYHFGTGIVDTPSDFGFLGSLPTHPELLDYLATRLSAEGWRLKRLHRELLLSETYRQASNMGEQVSANFEKGLQIDRQARLLWRFPPRRLSAEEIRDTMLVVAGKLRLEPMGGPGFRLYKFTQNNVCTYFPLEAHGADTYRRAVYHQNARASIVDMLSDFDLPDIAFAAPKRVTTTTPLQALTLLNHSFTRDMAAALAERCGAETADPIGRVYSLAFARAPTAVERQAATRLLAGHGLTALCRALLNSNELIHLE